MHDPLTHGPFYRTTDADAAVLAWDADETQWIFTDQAAYIIGYAPSVFRDAPMAQGFRITSPEELLRLLAV